MKKLFYCFFFTCLGHSQVSYELLYSSPSLSFRTSDFSFHKESLISLYGDAKNITVRENEFSHFAIDLFSNQVLRDEYFDAIIRPVDTNGHHSTLLSNRLISLSLSSSNEANENNDIFTISNFLYTNTSLSNPDFEGLIFRLKITNDVAGDHYLLTDSNYKSATAIVIINITLESFYLLNSDDLITAGEQSILIINAHNVEGEIISNYNQNHELSFSGLKSAPDGTRATYNGNSENTYFDVEFINGQSSVGFVAYNSGFSGITMQNRQGVRANNEYVYVLPTAIDVHNTDANIDNVTPNKNDTINISIGIRDVYDNDFSESEFIEPRSNDVKLYLNNSLLNISTDDDDYNYRASHIVNQAGENVLEVFINGIRVTNEFFTNGEFRFTVSPFDSDFHDEMIEKVANATGQSGKKISGYLSQNPISPNTQEVFVYIKGQEGKKMSAVISDIYGKVLREITLDDSANGQVKQYTWDVKSKEGNRLGSGVYILNIMNEDKEGFIFKFFIR